MQIPESIADQFLEFVDRNVDATKQARKSVRELDELFTAGFKGAEVNLVVGLIEELDSIETDTDNKQAELRAALYEIEDTLKAKSRTWPNVSAADSSSCSLTNNQE
jgi:uncharacterized protein Yka (UPF0111/DUF47 family)